MKGIIAKIAKTAVLATVLGLIVSGCAAQSGQPDKSFDETFRFVPRVHVEDNSFGVTGGGDFRGCSYDTQYEGYWCPKNR